MIHARDIAGKRFDEFFQACLRGGMRRSFPVVLCHVRKDRAGPEPDSSQRPRG